jgi:hypothetical protein
MSQFANANKVPVSRVMPVGLLYSDLNYIDVRSFIPTGAPNLNDPKQKPRARILRGHHPSSAFGVKEKIGRSLSRAAWR